MKLNPHLRHLIRAPTRLGGILPRSPQVGQLTYGIVPTSLPAAHLGSRRNLNSLPARPKEHDVSDADNRDYLQKLRTRELATRRHNNALRMATPPFFQGRIDIVANAGSVCIFAQPCCLNPPLGWLYGHTIIKVP